LNNVAHSRSHKVRLIVLAAVAAVAMTPFAPTSRVEAFCDQLSIPNLALERCVVPGAQAQINAGDVVRYTSLSSPNVSWLAGHHSSHGSTFLPLTDLEIGAEVVYRGVSYRVAEYRLVDRFSPGSVLDWSDSPTPLLVLQTSQANGNVHVWRAVPVPPTAPPEPPAPQVFAATGADRPGPSTEAVGRPSGVSIVAPVRLLDTRQGSGALVAGEVRRFDIPAGVGVPADAQAVFLNVTVVGLAPAGWVAVGPCDGELGRTSTVNWRGGDAAANDAIVGITNSSFCVTADRDAHVVLDLQGWVSAAATTGLSPVTPVRVLDTRRTPASPFGAGEMRRIQLPADVVGGARAAAVTVTAIGIDNAGYVAAQSCAQPAGLSSTVNTRVGVAVANSAPVPLDASGGFCVYSLHGAEVIVDLTAVFRDDGAHYQPVRPVRLIDTREASVPDQHRGWAGRPLDGGGVIRFPASNWRGVPANAAVAMNVTSVEPSADGYIAAWDCAKPQPSTSVQNPRRGEAVASQTVVSSGGEICVLSSTPAHMVVDLVGVWVR
jgi:hypothetical protein